MLPYVADVASRTLPLFPLPVVLFPGAPLPLHIFEPRYRRMLDDCLAGAHEFGLLFRSEEELELERGRVGCVAHIEETERLPDGRSNIVVVGRERFALDRIVTAPVPYQVAEVHEVEDDREPVELLAPLADSLRVIFQRVARAARTLADDPQPTPTLPDDAAQLSFAVASLIELDGATRQQLLSSRSPSGRLRELQRLLGRVVDAIELRAAVHVRARGNGHGPAAAES